MSAMIHFEKDDARVARHAFRLNVFESLTSPAITPDFRHVIVKDGEFLRLIMAFVGRADGDNGLAMLTTRNTPGAFELLNFMAMKNCAEAPQRKEVRKPCQS